MAKTEEKGKDSKESPAGDSSALGLLKSATTAALPIVVSAVVSVGFVALAGKAILWTRFEALQVPGDQVVKAVPQGEAVAVGASILLIFGLFGVLAALAVYLLDRSGRATASMSRGLLVIVAIEATVAIWHTHGKTLTSRIVADEIVVLAVAAIFWMTFVAGLTRQKVAPGGEDGRGDEAESSGPFFFVSAGELNKAAAQGRDPEPHSGIGRGERIAAPLVAVGAGLVAYGVAIAVGGGSGWALVAALAALGLAFGGAIVWHCVCFWQEKKDEAWRNAQERKGKKKRKKERALARRRLKKARKRVRRRRELLERLLDERGPSGSEEAATAIFALARDEEELERPASASEEPAQGVDLTRLGIGLVLGLAAVGIALPPLVLHEWWVAIALGAVAILGAGLWKIASLSKERFVWYGLAVFISVPLFATLMLMASNVDEPQVQPMALIRTTDGPAEAIQGLYVTESDDRVYFANVATEGCEDRLESHSGRLMWVPKSEVLAMSVGPLQGVKEAGKAALEMSYDLTPAVETGGAAVSLLTGKEELETGESKTPGANRDTRLEHVGPAVRPNFGSGLRIEPETVSPGGEATLRMSAPNQRVEGFGASRAGHNLRLGGRVVDIAKEGAGTRDAEYLETTSGRLINLDKQGAYVKDEEGGEFELAEGDAGVLYVRLDDAAILEVDGEPVGEEPHYVKVEEVEGVARVAAGEGKTVTLAGGTFEGRSWDAETVSLAELPLERQAWHPDRIRFHVPDDARTGVVGVECDQLAGSPLLRVSRGPQARLAVRTSPGSASVLLDGRASTSGEEEGGEDEKEGGKGAGEAAKEEPLKRRWKIDGVLVGHREAIHQRLAPRMRPYEIELTVVDEEGVSDAAKVVVLRLPAAALRPTRNPFVRARIRRGMTRARAAIRRSVEAERPKGVEIDNYASQRRRGGGATISAAQLADADVARERLLHDFHPHAQSAEVSTAARAVTVEELVHADRCSVGPRASSVDLFLLHDGVSVRLARGCRALSEKSARWAPPPGKSTG